MISNLSKALLLGLSLTSAMQTSNAAANLSPLQPVLSSEVYRGATNATPLEQEEAKKILMSIYSKAQGQPVFDELQYSIMECGAQMTIAGAVCLVTSGEGVGMVLYSALAISIGKLWGAGRGLFLYRRDKGKDLFASIEGKVIESIFNYPEVVLRKIQEAGQVARTDPHSRAAAINRMQLLVALPLNAPISNIKLNDLQTPEALLKTFNNHLTEAFSEDASNVGLKFLASNLVGFVRDVHNGESKLRYISICGPYGVGKTRITVTLFNVLEEILGKGSLYKYMATLESAKEIEGGSDTPSVLLKATGAAKAVGNARGLYIVMDEGSSQLDQLPDSAKRLFNSTTEVSGGLFLGTEHRFSALPTICFIIGNQPIQDPALASRMSKVTLVTPSKSALLNHVKQTAAQISQGDFGSSVSLTDAECCEIAESINNFRDVEDIIRGKIAEKMLKNSSAKKTRKRARSPAS